MDARVHYEAVAYLLESRKQLDALTNLLQVGKLTEAVNASTQFESLLEAAPSPLPEIDVMRELKVCAVLTHSPVFITSLCIAEHCEGDKSTD